MDPLGPNEEALLLGEQGRYDEARPARRAVELSERKFDVNALPVDLLRVYRHLEKRFGEEYGLLFVFSVRTAMELHRAWNMTLLTSTTLQLIKDEFGLRTTWNLGVVKLKFRVEDGDYELHRKVPYDYDSEYQDIYYRIAMALVARKITVHEALLYQSEAKRGIHTAGTGLFLRNFPGRLVLYPLQASMCAIIFFEGKWVDAGIAALCGLVAGIVEYVLSSIGGQANVLMDSLVGISTGIIGGLWYKHVAPCCLSAIFLGTLYWFFYGTAFVIGMLEIIAGELETGVTRFVAVSVKTFVLSLGAGLGLLLAVQGGASDVYFDSTEHCDGNFTKEQWWRIPIYLLCSVGVLGQYRHQINRYWSALIVQLVAYEVQYQVFRGMQETEQFTTDHLDTATSNIFGALVGVVSACVLSWIMDGCQCFYSARLLQEDDPSEKSKLFSFIYRCMGCIVKSTTFMGINRKSEVQKLDLEHRLKDQNKELNDPSHPRDRIEVSGRDENLLIETIVGCEPNNVWSILMPAVYQLVPGSIIAKLWFAAIFPGDTSDSDKMDEMQSAQESVFSSLMVTSTSLAIGLVFGFALVSSFRFIVGRSSGFFYKESDEKIANGNRRATVMEGMYTARPSPDDDPAEIGGEEEKEEG